jgi:hypothetical protein
LHGTGAHARVMMDIHNVKKPEGKRSVERYEMILKWILKIGCEAVD